MSTAKVIGDYRDKTPHTADECHYEQCEVCGCCAHGKTLREGCFVAEAPVGAQCSNDLCCCEGES